MRLVLDNNILFSLMNPKSTASYLFSSLRAGFLAPEFIKSELKKHKSACLFKSKLSEHEFEIRQKEVEESIKFIKVSEYEEFLEKAITLLSDPNDIDFLATALSLSNRRFVRDTKNPSDFSVSINATIWSNDIHFKQQSLVPVFTTHDLVRMFLKGKL